MQKQTMYSLTVFQNQFLTDLETLNDLCAEMSNAIKVKDPIRVKMKLVMGLCDGTIKERALCNELDFIIIEV